LVTFKLFNSAKQLPSTWDNLAVDNLFFKSNFLLASEIGIPENIKPYYLGVYVDNTLSGIAIFQQVNFNLGASLKEASSFFEKQLHKTINAVAKGQILVLGNLLQTGQHSYYFDDNFITGEQFFSIINDVLDVLILQIKKQTKQSVKCILLKDYYPSDSINKQDLFLSNNRFFEVKVQPNMVFNILENWVSFQDYTKALNKKYRRRFTTAQKKKNDIVSRVLNLHEIQSQEQNIFQLYNSVASNATINLFKLPEHHFSVLKTQLKDDFTMYGYFLNEKLIGFFSLIKNKTVLDTYFLGYNQSLNHKHQLYLNMLYDMIKNGLNHNFDTIIFARTAMEIKSSVGAKPKDMVMFMKHTNPLLNTILKWCVKVMTPKKEWEERHPF
jgi:hypothetical protein